MFTAADTEAMLRATGGVPVVYGSQSTWGHYDKASARAFDGTEVLATVPSVVIAAGALAGLAIGQPITVDGTAYVIRDFGAGQEYDTPPDGGLTRIYLAES